ncbi:hypothetical protein C8J57DRAFT_1251708 [Mycena rebaudengoi]|nr:hypothetical protein C8J57DRAFT_1251708 [Mycena rebaudengoi]
MSLVWAMMPPLPAVRLALADEHVADAEEKEDGDEGEVVAPKSREKAKKVHFHPVPSIYALEFLRSYSGVVAGSRRHHSACPVRWAPHGYLAGGRLGCQAGKKSWSPAGEILGPVFIKSGYQLGAPGGGNVPALWRCIETLELQPDWELVKCWVFEVDEEEWIRGSSSALIMRKSPPAKKHSHPKKNPSKISNPCKKGKFQFNQIKSAPATMREQHRANPHATPQRAVRRPDSIPPPKHYCAARTTMSPPPPPPPPPPSPCPRHPPPAVPPASRRHHVSAHCLTRTLCTPASAAAPSPHTAHYANPILPAHCGTILCLSSFLATPPPSWPPPISLSTGPFRPPQMHSRVLPTPSHSVALTLGNNSARCALFRHPSFPLDLWATRWLHPPTKPYMPPADTVKHPTTSNFDPPVLAVLPIACHSTAAVVNLATARFAVSYRRGGSDLMGDVYSTEGNDFWGSSSFRSILAPISHPALTRHPLAYGAPLAALQTACCGAFSPMMSPTVTRRSYTPTDSIFEFLDLGNGGLLTHASHQPPRSHRYPWTPSRKRILPYHDVQRRWQPRDVSYITPSSLASSQIRTRCGSMPFFPSPFRQQASIAAPDTNRSHGTVLA